jgi:hypothetical protein
LVAVQLPSVEQLGDELETLRRDAVALPDDPEAMLEHLAKLRTLAVYLNVHLTAPKIAHE